MKNRITGFGRKFTSVAVLLCLLFSIFAPTVMALEDAIDTKVETVNAEPGSKGPLNYVSIGDSMANGYGFVGYEQDSADLGVYNTMVKDPNGVIGNDTGLNMYGAGAYPLQFENYLEKNGYTVNHTKLATSAMLPNDFYYLLGGMDAEVDDGWAGYRNYIGSRTSDAKFEELVAAFRNHVQVAVTNADVITFGLGNAAFGAFLLQHVTDALGVFDATFDDTQLNLELALKELDEEDRTDVVNFVNAYLSQMDLSMAYEMLDEATLNNVLNILEYTVGTFIVYYKLCVEKILEMNPDVEIIFVGLLNTTYGMKIAVDENPENNFPVGDMMDEAFGMLNDYVKMVPTLVKAERKYPEASFKFAEQPDPKFICQVFGDLAGANWGAIDCGDPDCGCVVVDENDENREKTFNACENGRLSGATVRSRNIDAYNGSLRPLVSGAFSEMLGGNELPEITLDMVKNMDSDAPDLNEFVRFYIAKNMENDVLDVAKQMNSNFDNLEGEEREAVVDAAVEYIRSEYVSEQDQEGIKSLYSTSVGIYLGFEDAIAECADEEVLTLSGLLAIATDMMSVFNNFALDEDDVRTSLGDYLCGGDTYTQNGEANPDIRGMVKIYALFKVGNGMSVHPTPAGHDDIVKTVIKAYEGEAMGYDSEVVALRDVYFYLENNGYITVAQALELVAASSSMSTFELLDYLYNVILVENAKTDAERLEIIGTVYALLKGDFLGGGSPVLETVGNIYFALKDQGLINESQAFAIVDFVYNCIIDGEFDSKDIVAVIKYVYYTLFFTEKTETVEFSLCADLGDYNFPELEELQALGAGEKVAILNTVVEELKAGGYVTEDSTFAPIVTLYDNLANNSDEDISVTALAAVIDIAIEAVIAREELAGEDVLDIGFEIVENVANSPAIPEDAREFVANEIYNAVTNVEIGGNAGESAPVIPEGILNVIDRLYVRGLITRTQVLQITAKLRPLVSGSEDVSVIDLVKDVADIVFGREGITTQDKILIVLNLYTALKNEGYITDEQLVQFVEDYYIVALGMAVLYAYQEGYVDIAIDALYDAADAIEAAKAEIESSDLDAALKEAVIAELDAAVATILNVADTASNPEFENQKELIYWLRDLKLDVYAHIERAQAILDLAGNNSLDEAIKIWENDVKPEIDKLVKDIEENGLEYFAEALKEIAPVVGNAAWEALLGTPEAIKAFIEFTKNYGPYVIDFFEEYGVEFVTFFGNIAVEYGVDTLAALINQGEEVLESLKVLVDALGDEAWETIRLYADALDLEAQVMVEYYRVIDTVKGQIDVLNGYLVTLEGELDNIEAALKDAAYEAQEALNKQVEAINRKIEEIKSCIRSLEAELEKLLKEAADIAEKIKDLAIAIKDLANAIMSGANDAILDAFERLYNALSDLAALVEGAESLLGRLYYIVNSIADLADSIATAFENLADGLYAFANALKAFADEAMNEIAEKLSGLAADIAYKAACAAEKLGEAAEKLGNAVEKAREAVVAFAEYVENVYYHALHGDYTFDRGNSHYVAIGDAFAADGALSYVDILAELLTMNENHYTDLTRGAFGFTVEEALAFIEENRDVIASSDLITFSYNNISVFNAIISILGESANLDSQIIDADINWAALFGEDVAATIETALANVEDVIAEELVKLVGEDIQSIETEKLVSLASEILEIYVYAYISRMATIHNVIEELRLTAPEALIVIVGAFNDFEGLVFDSAEFGLDVEFTVEIGEYVGFVVDALNASAFISALIDENTIFVSTEGVEKEIDTAIEGSATIMDYLDVLYAPDLLLPSVAGNADIADRILDALNVSFAEHEHKYDNRCDTTCNTCGDERYAEHTYANACDAICNICGYERDDAADHVYDADCDATCNVCGATRAAAAHTFGSWKTDRESTYNVMGRKVRSCTKCGYAEYEYLPVLVAENAEKGGASAGVIVAITIPSVLALAAGGFSAFWFGYKKKTIKDLAKVLEKALAVFKK